ncbi:MAG: TIGR00730 family Rossman fold protein [Chloroflexota bacterium]
MTTIAVFGSARAKRNSDVYSVTEAIGKALADAGYAVMTGGYAGVMEAASKGAADAGGTVLGITVKDLELVGESRINDWVTDEVRYQKFDDRLAHLINEADAYVIMPGGIGTAQELIDVWQNMRIGDLPRKPLLIYGDFWHPLISNMLDAGYIGEKEMALLNIFATPEQAISTLDNWFNT